MKTLPINFLNVEKRIQVEIGSWNTQLCRSKSDVKLKDTLEETNLFYGKEKLEATTIF